MSASGNPPAKPAHSAADHLLGAMSSHAHAPGEEADHDHDSDDSLLAEGSQENARTLLTSIGVDIGSSGTQIAFSRLMMHGPGEPAAMRRHAKSRETLYLSPVVMTPFASGDTIDIERLRGTLARAFEEAGLSPDDIETGAVLMTGAAAQRANAQMIADMIAQDVGDLVAAAAGDHMEAVLSAYGSGAVERSRAGMNRILNIDIGGATSKFAIVDCGRIVAVAAIAAGGRQIAFDSQGRITRCDARAHLNAKACGFNLRAGDVIDRAGIEKLAGYMAQQVHAFACGRAVNEDLLLTPPLAGGENLDGVMFSGGVAEYIYGYETRSFGDPGRAFGQAIAQQFAQGLWPWPLLEAGERIRATVMGASEHSVQLSGATGYISNHAALLPRRNLPVLQPPFDFTGAMDADGLAQAIARHRQNFGDDDPHRECVFAFRWRGAPEHARLRAFAGGLRLALADRIAAGTNLYFLIENDAAHLLGSMLREECGVTNEMAVFDSIALRDLDFCDIGRIRLPSGMTPVTIKSLLFGKPPGSGNR